MIVFHFDDCGYVIFTIKLLNNHGYVMAMLLITVKKPKFGEMTFSKLIVSDITFGETILSVI